MSTSQNHKHDASHQLSLLVDMNSPHSVLEEVKTLFLDIFNKAEFSLLVAAFDNVLSLFNGHYAGYKACDTPYHNLKHTTDVFLAMARLIHGAFNTGKNLSEDDVTMSLLGALMHDTGYVLKDSDSQPSGALLAPNHVPRSVEFMAQCLTQNGYPIGFIEKIEKIILFTDHENSYSKLYFSTRKLRLLGTMLASADLLAQTADRTYLEKLPLLYREFKEVGIGNYDSAFDLIKNAVLFNDQMHLRLVHQLDNVKRYLTNHFKVRWDIDEDLYQEAVDRSMLYLQSALLPDTDKYKSHLRRGLKAPTKIGCRL